MNHISGFPPIAKKDAKILILGSMPSMDSLSKQQYYAHPRNSFWPIMHTLFNENHSVETGYLQRKESLIINNIAVWDVLQNCCRVGSLDSKIKMSSIQINDFQTFFKQHPAIKKVCFNGAKAEHIYFKSVLPVMNNCFEYMSYVKLPSTSPAYAAMTVQEKTSRWKKELKDNRL